MLSHGCEYSCESFDLGLTVPMYIFNLELGVVGGLITPVRSLMLSLSLLVYQVRLDWLLLPCIALIRPSQLSCLGNPVGRAFAS